MWIHIYHPVFFLSICCIYFVFLFFSFLLWEFHFFFNSFFVGYTFFYWLSLITGPWLLQSNTTDCTVTVLRYGRSWGPLDPICFPSTDSKYSKPKLCSNLKNPSWLLLRLHWGSNEHLGALSVMWPTTVMSGKVCVSGFPAFGHFWGSTPFSTRQHHPFSYRDKSAILTTQVLKYDRATMKLRLPDKLNAHFITVRLLCSFFLLPQIDLFFSTDANSLQSGERQNLPWLIRGWSMSCRIQQSVHVLKEGTGF